MRKLLSWLVALSISGLPLAAAAGGIGPSGDIHVEYDCEGAGAFITKSGGSSVDADLEYQFGDGPGGNVARTGQTYSAQVTATSTVAGDVLIAVPAAATKGTCLIGGSVSLSQPITYTHPVTDTVNVQVRASLAGWKAHVPANAPPGSDMIYSFDYGLGSDFVSETFVLNTSGLTTNQPDAWIIDPLPGGGISVSGTLVMTTTLNAPAGPFSVQLSTYQDAFVPAATVNVSMTSSIPADALRFEVVSLTPGVDFASLGVHPGDGSQTKPQQKCLTGLNKAVVKVVRAQLKLNEKCIKDATKGKENSAQSCVQVDPKGKVLKASEKAMNTDEKKCQMRPDQLPTFSYVSADISSAAAMNEGQSYLSDLLGPNADTAIPSDKGEAGCQQGLLKSADKVLLALLGEAIKAKKAALKDGADGPAAFESAMLASLASSKKLPKLEGKVATTADKKCADVVNLSSLFPGAEAAGITPASVADGAIRSAHDRACRLLNTFDNLSLDCDAY